MPRGGNNRLPDEAKANKGTLVKNRVNPSAPKVQIVPVPDPPEETGEQERRVWLDYKDDVDSIGTYSESNDRAFRRMVKVAARLERLEAQEPQNDKAIDAADHALLRWMAAFGLTPQDRSRISVAPQRKERSAFQERFGALKN